MSQRVYHNNVTDDDDENTPTDIAIAVIGQILVFFLVLGFGATISFSDFHRSTFSKGTVICFITQFILMPFIGYLLVLAMTDLEPVAIVTLMIVLSSPGGTYSNFFCALFNADLSQSVAMTGVSTFLAVVTLPLNLLFYLNFLLDRRNVEKVGDLIDWGILSYTVLVVLAGITVGLYLNSKLPDKVQLFNIIGNLCGFCLILLGMAVSNSDKPLWEQPPEIVISACVPPLISIFLTTGICLYVNLERPKLVAVVIEVCLQNSGIAIGFALIAFNGDDQSTAVSLAILYGISTSLYGIIFSAIAVRRGWTYTPKGISTYKMLAYNYQPRTNQTHVDESNSSTKADSEAEGSYTL